MAASRGVVAVLMGLSMALLTVHVSGQLRIEPMTEICLGCICEAVSNCDRNLTCAGDVCGIFRMTWAYWADSGKPLLTPQDDVNAPDAYPRCANDNVCAGKTVTGYMNKFGQDCNGDGAIDCFDYAAIHRLGGYGCRAPLDIPYRDKFQACINAVQLYVKPQG